MKKQQAHIALALAIMILALQAASGQTARQRVPTAREIAQKTLPSVVLLVTEDSNGKPKSLGSGFFVQNDIIATNYHVIEGASWIGVKLVRQEGDYAIDSIIGEDKEKDLALLKVAGGKARPLPFGDSNKVAVGDVVYAVGNPEGFEGTFSQGIVSGIRQLDGQRYIQITAPVSHGSSGGPILNRTGEVIGVAVASLEEGQNLNFAVPVIYLSTLISRMRPGIAPTPQQEITFREEDIDKTATASKRGTPLSAEEHFKRGELYFNNANYDLAAEEYKLAALLKGRKYPEAFYGLGESYLRLQDGRQALEAYKLAIEVKPNYAEAHIGVALSYLKLERYEEAIEAGQVAIRIEPNNSKAFLVMGLIYNSLAESNSNNSDSRRVIEFRQKSKDCLIEAIRLDSKNFHAYSWLGSLYRKENRFDEELSIYKKALQVFLDSPALASDYVSQFTVYVALSNFYKSNGRLSEGIELFSQIVKLKPKDGEAYLHLGELYVHAKDKLSALKVYEKLQSVDRVKASLLFAEIYK